MFSFNECESFHKFDGITFCPKCHPEEKEQPPKVGTTFQQAISQQSTLMDEEIEKIIPPALPFDVDDKIFIPTDWETGDPNGEPYSYNDWIKQINDISGVSPELLGVSQQGTPCHIGHLK
jgi:hypothetical protein